MRKNNPTPNRTIAKISQGRNLTNEKGLRTGVIALEQSPPRLNSNDIAGSSLLD
jgi:hypothetical protein